MELSSAIERPRVDGVIARRCTKPWLLGRNGSLAITSHHLIYSIKDDEVLTNVAKVADGDNERELCVCL
jgi:hypothetical protein